MAIVVLGFGADIASHASMPLVAPGGSAIVATCLALGWIAAQAGPDAYRRTESTEANRPAR